MNTDKGLLQIIAIGRNNKFDYLQNLVDMFDRDRVKHLKLNPDKGYVYIVYILSALQGHSPYETLVLCKHLPQITSDAMGETRDQ